MAGITNENGKTHHFGGNKTEEGHKKEGQHYGEQHRGEEYHKQEHKESRNIYISAGGDLMNAFPSLLSLGYNQNVSGKENAVTFGEHNKAIQNKNDETHHVGGNETEEGHKKEEQHYGEQHKGEEHRRKEQIHGGGGGSQVNKGEKKRKNKKKKDKKKQQHYGEQHKGEEHRKEEHEHGRNIHIRAGGDLMNAFRSLFFWIIFFLVFFPYAIIKM